MRRRRVCVDAIYRRPTTREAGGLGARPKPAEHRYELVAGWLVSPLAGVVAAVRTDLTADLTARIPHRVDVHVGQALLPTTVSDIIVPKPEQNDGGSASGRSEQ